MGQEQQKIVIEPVTFEEVAEALRHTAPFRDVELSQFGGVGPMDRITASAGAILGEPSDPARHYCVLLAGEVRAERPEPDGSQTMVGIAKAGEGFGETLLLTGKTHKSFLMVAAKDTVLIRFSEEAFWSLLACCPSARAVVLGDMAQRLQAYQVEALHREKLISLGTLAAGLMHELHNPGSAAKRASSQLRLNLLKLQELSLRFADAPKTPDQLGCMRDLLQHTMNGCTLPAMSSIEQSDAEEQMADWLAAAGVDNAFSIAPALIGIGLKQDELLCARDAFPPANFSDALNWLEALVSSVTLVCTIEESVTRVSDLVMAVKKFAYDEKSPARFLDVHDSLQSTLTILGHKLRIKGIHVEKDFAANPALIQTRGSSLSQVWTNLIDNALDASPSDAKIKISTWIEAAAEVAETGADEPGLDRLAVAIEDHGEGIPAEVLPRIFDAFFYHQAAGVGHRSWPGDRPPHRDAEVRRQHRRPVGARPHLLHRSPADQRRQLRRLRNSCQARLRESVRPQCNADWLCGLPASAPANQFALIASPILCPARDRLPCVPVHKLSLTKSS
jgi:signal transduction histidine kinase